MVVRALISAVLLAVLNLCVMVVAFLFRYGDHGPSSETVSRAGAQALVLGAGLAAGAGWAWASHRLQRSSHAQSTRFVIETLLAQGAAVLATLPFVGVWSILVDARNWHELLGAAVVAAAIGGFPLGLLLASLDAMAEWMARRETSPPVVRPARESDDATGPIRPWPFALLALVVCAPALFLSELMAGYSRAGFQPAYLVAAGLWLVVVIRLAVLSIRRTGKATVGVMLWGSVVAQAEAVFAMVAFGRLGVGENPDDKLLAVCIGLCVGGGFLLGLLAWGAGALARPRAAGS